MPRFDRYLLSQLLTVFGFFSLVLVMVYWIRAAVTLFDRLISDGQSARVVLELTALSLPSVIQIVLPLAAFAAAVYVTNRLTSDSELVVMQGTGFSPFRMVRPALFFGIIITLLTMVVTHFLVPEAAYTMRVRNAEISQNITARLLVEGQFQTPTDDLTVYIREVTRNGELVDLFLSDTRSETQEVIYTATKAYLIRNENGPQLVMVEGQAQTLDYATNRLMVTTFDDFAYDLGDLITTSTNTTRRISHYNSIDLWFPSDQVLEDTGRTAGVLAMEAHSRNAGALLALVGAVLGAASLLVGGFSRFGVWKQVVLAIFLVIAVKFTESMAANAARTQPENWLLPYIPIVFGLAVSFGLLVLVANPTMFKRSKRQVLS
ncbi:LPS export ABC transporter permease LptF [Marivivens niveibacter]|uniref:LPS export ABC transporter permease LptF n=1 Tax=Marivivens niveibacter TaxID=1930667 RepID=A0A251X244_9RHOB|nr:LPS export ABC transporter permease LptF [Marivivens niveibacter]OUD10779.1 LPS export ABC transporter permease LptF [Marivivens niveibacter]